MHTLTFLLPLLAALPLPPQKSGSGFKTRSPVLHLEVGGDVTPILRFDGSAQRSAVIPSSGAGGSSLAKAPPVVATLVELPLVPGAGVCAALEQAFTNGVSGDWTVREFDFQGSELFVHGLEGVRLRSLELDLGDVGAKEPPTWSAHVDVALVKLSQGTTGKSGKLLPKAKQPSFAGVRITLDGKEIERVRSVHDLRFEFPSLSATGSSKARPPTTQAATLRVRQAGSDVKPWLGRLGGSTTDLQVELLELLDTKPGVAASVRYEQAQLVAVARPCDTDQDELELEFLVTGPRLSFPAAP